MGNRRALDTFSKSEESREMKRKIFMLAVAVAMLVCALSISVSADDMVVNTVTSETYGTVYQLSQDPGLDGAAQYVSTLNTIEDQGTDTESWVILTDGTYYYVFPTSYIVDEYKNGKLSFTFTTGSGNNNSSTQKGINNVFAEWVEAEGVTLPTFAFTGTWGSTKYNAIVRIELSKDITYIDRAHCLIKSENLKEVRLTRTLNFNNAGGVFSGNTMLEAVVGLEIYATNFKKASSAFAGCTSLVSIALPSDMTSIPNEMFYNCTSFTGVTNWDELKDNITSIGSSSFYNCDALVSIALPAITSIGSQAFRDCALLETVDLIGASFVKLNSAFRGCPKLDGIVLPDTVDGISQDGFNGCSSLTSIVIPRDCQSISPYAFSGCSSLKVVDMSKAVNLKSTGQNAFSGTIVEELIFPEGFESFGGISTYTLKVLVFPDSTTNLSVIKGGITEFKVPLGVTSFGNKTFDYCSSLTTLTIHGGVTSLVIGNNPSLFGSTLSNLKTINYTGSETDAFVELLKTAAPNAEIVYVDHCETYLGGHAWLGQNNVLSNNYLEEISIADACSACAKSKIKQTIEPLFISKGVSAKTYGTDIGLVQGYEVNRTAIEEYRVFVPEFDFGVLAFANNTGAAVSPKPGDEKVIVVSFDNMANDYIEVKLLGIPDSYRDVAVVFCVYATHGDKLYYLNDGEMTDSIIGKSFNEIINK